MSAYKTGFSVRVSTVLLRRTQTQQDQVFSMQNRRLQASITLMVGGAFWGLLWIPLRAIQDLGVEKAWATLLIFSAPAILLIPLSIYRWKIISAQLGTFLAVGLF